MKKIRNNDRLVNSDVPTWGPAISSVFEEVEAELSYIEQYVPRAGDNIHIYWSGCDFWFGPRGGYAGIQHLDDAVVDGQIFTYNNICSIWDLVDNPDESEVRLDYGIEGLHSSHFGGEGTGLHTSHPMPWSPDQWYAIVIRRWYIPGEEVTRMAMFMYSYADERWTHYMSASVPEPDVPLSGTTCTGFLERFYGDALGYYGVYGQHFRMNKDGTWQKPLYYVAGAGGEPSKWNATLTYNGGDGGDTNIKLIAGGTHENTEPSLRLEPNQFDDKPKPVTPPRIDFFRAAYNPQMNEIHLQWAIPVNSPPQLSFHIVIREEMHSAPLTYTSEAIPHQREYTFYLVLPAGSYVATLIITDIFNQDSVGLIAPFIVY
ncbi:DUF3472 domain-containing protein [Pseudomonas viridiflava]|uniref:DUF3472 domain-containing protein n=1 Tax=Pseudomonas viridiflava TaxID=33069 RepID=UPI000F04B1A4|nr:DUF3472 domain-containing protein [Pseudomonas viridiflava]